MPASADSNIGHRGRFQTRCIVRVCTRELYNVLEYYDTSNTVRVCTYTHTRGIHVLNLVAADDTSRAAAASGIIATSIYELQVKQLYSSILQ
jgi:hypothetical protein